VTFLMMCVIEMAVPVMVHWYQWRRKLREEARRASAEGARIEAPSGVGSGRGVPSPADEGFWGSVVNPAGPETHFGRIFG